MRHEISDFLRPSKISGRNKLFNPELGSQKIEPTAMRMIMMEYISYL